MAEQDKGKSSGLQLDSTKKYTLVFLVSLGTTLLVTGFSGGRLLKRAKQDATPAATAAAAGTARGAAADGAAAKSEIAAKVKAATAANAAASTEKDGYTRAFERAQSQPSTSTAPTLQAPSISASLQPRRSRARRNSLLASWWTSAHGPDLSFWLSNPSLVKMSLMAAEEDKRIERGGVARASGTALPLYPDDGRPQLAPQRVHVHGQGSKWREAHESAPETEDRFNAAFYAFKAFGIATVLTTSGFAAGIFLLMRHYKVDNASDFALALSESLHLRVSGYELERVVPDWARVSSPSAEAQGTLLSTDSSASDKAAEEVAREQASYWDELKRELDSEAREDIARRRERWVAIQKPERHTTRSL